MQNIIEFREAASQEVRSPAAQPLSVEPILAVIDSLSRTLECIKSLCATAPNGAVRDSSWKPSGQISSHRAFLRPVAAMRVSSAESRRRKAVSSDLQVASRR
jgi:hypothetical protein